VFTIPCLYDSLGSAWRYPSQTLSYLDVVGKKIAYRYRVEAEQDSETKNGKNSSHQGLGKRVL